MSMNITAYDILACTCFTCDENRDVVACVTICQFEYLEELPALAHNQRRLRVPCNLIAIRNVGIPYGKRVVEKIAKAAWELRMKADENWTRGSSLNPVDELFPPIPAAERNIDKDISDLVQGRIGLFCLFPTTTQVD